MRREFTLQLYDRMEPKLHAHDCPVCGARIPCTLPMCEIEWVRASGSEEPYDLGHNRNCAQCDLEEDPLSQTPHEYCRGCGSAIASNPEWQQGYVGPTPQAPHHRWCMDQCLNGEPTHGHICPNCTMRYQCAIPQPHCDRSTSVLCTGCAAGGPTSLQAAYDAGSIIQASPGAQVSGTDIVNQIGRIKARLDLMYHRPGFKGQATTVIDELTDAQEIPYRRGFKGKP